MRNEHLKQSTGIESVNLSLSNVNISNSSSDILAGVHGRTMTPLCENNKYTVYVLPVRS